MMLPHQKKTWRLAGLADLADDGPLSRAATRQIAVPNSQLAPAHPGLASQSACILLNWLTYIKIGALSFRQRVASTEPKPWPAAYFHRVGCTPSDFPAYGRGPHVGGYNEITIAEWAGGCGRLYGRTGLLCPPPGAPQRNPQPGGLFGLGAI